MNIYEVMFILGFVCAVIITLAKLYNVLNMCKWMDWRHSLLAWVVGVILWYVTIVSFMANVSNHNMVGYLNFSTFVYRLMILMSVVELFLYLGAYFQEKTKNLGINRERYIYQEKTG